MQTTDINRRRYDLDWLRVIAFGLLIFYHVGMFYVPWDWHVKSTYVTTAPEGPMMLLNPWRLSLLFLISGVALRYAADKVPALRFTASRFFKLFIPLVFGMAVIVAPQSYFQLLRLHEIGPGFLAFWPRYLGHEHFSVMVPTWNHLWYVAYLIVYTLVAMALMPALRRLAKWLDRDSVERALSGGRILVLPLLPFILYRFTTDYWFPTTHALVDDWNAHANFFTIFLYGLLLAKNGAFWRAVQSQWRLCLAVAVGLGVVLTPVWSHWDAWMQDKPVLIVIAQAARVFYAWAAILSLLGAAQAYLNRPSPLLSYLTRAIFPFYILHQTLIVVFGVWLSRYQLGAVPEFLALVGLTSLGCIGLYEYLIRPLPWLRPLFGVFGEAPSLKALRAKALGQKAPAAGTAWQGASTEERS
ncbi:acyltransferase family protein [Gallaecimonas kandeliae]|uniref:acyltransferase family protein n=1 Tax=Gallaecimonas kandeliae TaxID=3029055 RepID=UPI0026493160|nr:acyltransferase family protein [Gallaecimonas kandeliae]WKE65880.1 acyltransferase family protein [Gallaecimonas kandeliae]